MLVSDCCVMISETRDSVTDETVGPHDVIAGGNVAKFVFYPIHFDASERGTRLTNWAVMARVGDDTARHHHALRTGTDPGGWRTRCISLRIPSGWALSNRRRSSRRP